MANAVKNHTHVVQVGRRTTDRREFRKADGERWKRAVTVATVQGDVTLYIDLRALESYALRSLLSKRGQCRLAGGAIIFAAANRQETPVPAPVNVPPVNP